MKLRVLNLEDNPNDTELTLAELSREWPDIDIVRTDSRNEFITLLDQNKFDLILADFSLPDFDGLSALAIVNEKFPEIPFIFLSGAMGEENAIETLKQGATDFVIKGRLFRLIPAVRRALAESEKHKIQRETQEKIKYEMEINSHLLMIAEATAQITDINRLLKQVVSCGHVILKYDYCLLYLYNEKKEAFRPVERHGLSNEMTARFMMDFLPVETRYVKEAIEKKEPVIVPVLPKNDNLSELFGYIEEKNTLAVIPLFARKELLGIILAFYKEKTEFGERQKKIMQGVAHQTSIALDQARLYRNSVERSIELSAKIETIQVMNEIDKSILSTLNIDEILENVTRLVSRLISCEIAMVNIIDNEKKGFVFAAGLGINRLKKGDLIPFNETSSIDVMETGKMEYIANLADQKDRRPFEEALFKQGILSHIRFPLYVRGEISAVLGIGSKRISAFTVDNLSVLENLADQVGIALNNATLLSDIENLFIGTVKSLSSTIDAKSHWTAGHSANVTMYAMEIGKKMSFSQEELKNLELASLLHDIGKLATYEWILDKPEELTEEEYNIIKNHPVKGAEILSPIVQLKNVIPAIRHHHEFFNGSGYPDGLKGTNIPVMARIVSVADSVDAMISDRPYRKGLSKDNIVRELETNSGIQFDPEVVRVFLQSYKQF